MSLPIVDLIAWGGEIAFAASGALLAARHRLDPIGFLFMANVTGIGGGTVRDLVLGLPVFWVHEPEHVLLCSAVAILTWLGAGFVQRASRPLVWADAVGISLFSVIGAQKALLAGAAPTVAVVMGMFTACLGGIIRDVLMNDPPILMSREIYVTATLAGAGTYALLAMLLGPQDHVALLSGVLVAFGLRALAIARNVTLPSHPGLG